MPFLLQACRCQAYNIITKRIVFPSDTIEVLADPEGSQGEQTEKREKKKITGESFIYIHFSCNHSVFLKQWNHLYHIYIDSIMTVLFTFAMFPKNSLYLAIFSSVSIFSTLLICFSLILNLVVLSNPHLLGIQNLNSHQGNYHLPQVRFYCSRKSKYSFRNRLSFFYTSFFLKKDNRDNFRPYFSSTGNFSCSSLVIFLTPFDFFTCSKIFMN